MPFWQRSLILLVAVMAVSFISWYYLAFACSVLTCRVTFPVLLVGSQRFFGNLKKPKQNSSLSF